MINVSLEEALLLQKSEINALTNMVIHLREENKQLKEELSDAKWWLVRILNNNENASDFQKYMREEFGEVIK